MADRIVKCAAALAGASYHDAPPSAELRDLWRDMAADARQEADELRAEIKRLKSPAVVLAEAERLLREVETNHVYFSSSGRVTICLRGLRTDWRGATLAEAYEKLRGGENG